MGKAGGGLRVCAEYALRTKMLLSCEYKPKGTQCVPYLAARTIDGNDTCLTINDI